MYTGDINSYMYEINGLESEIQIHRKRLKQLVKRKGELLNKIVEQLEEQDEKQIVFKGKKYILEEKQKNNAKPKKKKKQDVLEVLSQVVEERHEAEEIYKQVENAMKGESKKVYSLKQPK